MTQQGKCCFEHQTLSWTGASPGPSLCSSQCPHELTSPRTGPSQDQVSVPHTISYRWYRAVGAWRSQKFLLYMRKLNTSYLPGPFSCWASNIFTTARVCPACLLVCTLLAAWHPPPQLCHELIPLLSQGIPGKPPMPQHRGLYKQVFFIIVWA